MRRINFRKMPKKGLFANHESLIPEQMSSSSSSDCIPCESDAGRQSPGNEARWWAVLHVWFVDWPSFPGSCSWPAVASMEERRDLFTLTCLICPVNCIQNCLVYPPLFLFFFNICDFFRLYKNWFTFWNLFVNQKIRY